MTSINNIPRHLFQEGHQFISFDVESLFTNVPLKHTVKRAQTMGEVIKSLKFKLVIKEAERLLSTFEGTHFLYNFNENRKCPSTGRRYSNEIKEFTLTLYF